MPSLLLCCLTASEADVSGMKVELDPSRQYPVTFCCHVTDGSREVVWYNGVWHGSAFEKIVCHWIPSCRKMAPTDMHWCLLNICGDQIEDVSTVRWWVVCFSSSGNNVKDKSHSGHRADFYKCSMQVLVHCWQKCIVNGGDCVEKHRFVAENLLSQIELFCSLYLL